MIFFKKSKPIYSLNPVEVKAENGEKRWFILMRDEKTGGYKVPIKSLNSLEMHDKKKGEIETLAFKDWKDVKNLFDEQSRKVIEENLKNFKSVDI